MRILQVHTPYRSPAGEDAVVENERRALADAGHKVRQVLLSNPTTTGSTLLSMGASSWNLRSARTVRREIEAFRPDVAHVHNTWFAGSGSVVATIHGKSIPMVMTLHNYRFGCLSGNLFRDGDTCEDCVGGFPWRGVTRRCYRNSLALSAVQAGALALNRATGVWLDGVDVFAVLTVFARGRFEAMGLPRSRMIVKPNFVPAPSEDRQPPSRSDQLLFVGRLAPEKGVELLTEAWSTDPVGRLVIVGDGPMRSDLQHRHPNIDFRGKVDSAAVRSLMLSSRALLVPSLCYEGLPTVILEAFSTGLPVLGSDIGGTGETVRKLGPDVAVTAKIGEWSGAMHRLMNDSWVDGLSSRATALYDREYSPATGARRLVDLYRRAIRHRTDRYT